MRVAAGAVPARGDRSLQAQPCQTSVRGCSRRGRVWRGRRPPLRRTCGRPTLDEPADILVWDVSELSAADLTWLAMLTANRPDLAVVLLDSFPRGDSTLAVLRAGARAVISRPMSLETLAGMLLRLETSLPA